MTNTRDFCISLAETGSHTALETTTTQEQNSRNHLIEIPGEPWAFWTWSCLRGAGFPSSLAGRLSSETCAAAADRFLVRQEELTENRKEVLSAFQRAHSASQDEEKRKSLGRSVKKLLQGKVPDSGDPSLEIFQRELSAFAAQARDAEKQFRDRHRIAVLETSGRIREIASDARFRRAVLLQNRTAVRLGIDTLLRHGDRRGKKERQYEELIASYLQRYCLKNDTIGFFGPTGWARFQPHAEDIVIFHGPDLVANSGVYFENWGIEALAAKMSENAALKPWIAPRLSPHYHVEKCRLHSPGGASSQLDPFQAAILELCDGERTAREIAGEILLIAGADSGGERRVYQTLQALHDKRVVLWKLEIPISLHPEQTLLSLLRKIGPADFRQTFVESAEELDRAREDVARCIDDATKLDESLDRLDQTFTRLTAKASTKSAGAMYAARTLIYHDSRRDLTLEIGRGIMLNLGEPLSLLLCAARWFTYRAAAALRPELERLTAEVSARNGNGPVDLLRFWAKIESLIFDQSKGFFNGVVGELQMKWARILRADETAHHVEYRSEDLRIPVEAEFSAPRPGWEAARYHSPDVMIAAKDVDAIRRGDYFFVLGELHLAFNTMRYSFNVAQHPFPEQLFDAIEGDSPEPHVIPVPPRRWPRVTNRTYITLLSPRDYHLELSPDARANAPRSQVVSCASLVVENSSEGLVVRTRDGRLSFDAIEFLGELLSGTIIDQMKILPSMPHSPRITIDRLVVRRESWTFLAADLQFVTAAEEHERYLGARAWMRRHGLPRFVFARVATEVKPFYLDFNSTVYVEIFAKIVRRLLAGDRASEKVSISEMLPGPDQLWLPDADGNVYTSEFRIAVRDLAGQ